MDTPKTCLTDGSAPSPGWDEIQADGQQLDHLVLCPEERAKGYVRPLRMTYKHVGVQPKYPLRLATPEELVRHAAPEGSMYEEYPESERPLAGKLWRPQELRGRCGSTTTMGMVIAETYARDPAFYTATFCVCCQAYFAVAEFVWLDGSRVGS